jgi:hypothetical protein
VSRARPEVDPRITGAVAAGALLGLLRGDPPWAIANPWADTPTDPMAVFAGYRAAFSSRPEQMRALATAVRALADDASHAWMAVYYVLDILDHRRDFPGLEAVAFATGVLTAVRSHEDALRRERRWLGASGPDGCWGVVARLLPAVSARLERAGQTP